MSLPDIQPKTSKLNAHKNKEVEFVALFALPPPIVQDGWASEADAFHKIIRTPNLGYRFK
jgi:hypothetical protein